MQKRIVHMLNNHDDNIIYMCIQIRVGGIWGGEGGGGKGKSEEHMLY